MRIRGEGRNISFDYRCSRSICDIDFDVVDVYIILEKLPPIFTSGPDELPQFLFGRLAVALALPLTAIFQKIALMGVHPSSWKISYVRPLHKRGIKSDPGNYRPIRITSVSSRIFERLVYRKIESFLVSQQFFNERQFGFRRRRSAVVQELLCLNQWQKAIEVSMQ